MGYAKAPATIGLTVQHQARARRIATGKPGLVEEGRSHRAALVEHTGLDEPAHAALAHRSTRDRAYLDRYGCLLTLAQRTHHARLAVVARQVLKQIANRLDPKRRHAVGRLAGREVQG